MDNIYSTVEADAWSRGFCYMEYERLCEVTGTKPMCLEAYLTVCKAFAAQMHHDLGPDRY